MTVSEQKKRLLSYVEEQLPQATSFKARLSKLPLRDIAAVLKERLYAALDERDIKSGSALAYLRLTLCAVKSEHLERHAEPWETEMSLFHLCEEIAGNRSLLAAKPAAAMSEIRRELVDAMVRVWIHTEPGETFRRYTESLLSLESRYHDPLYHVVRHERFNFAKYPRLREELEAIDDARNGDTVLTRIMEALDQNRFSSLSSAGTRRFAGLANALDTHPEFVIEEMMAVRDRYEHLIGLNKAIIAQVVTPFAVEHGLDELGESMKFAKDDQGVVEAIIIFHSFKAAPDGITTKIDCLVGTRLPSFLAELALDKMAPAYMGLGRLTVKFAEHMKLPVTLTTVELPVRR